MKFLIKILKSAIGIFLVKKWIEYYEKKSKNRTTKGKITSIFDKILPFVKKYLDKK